MAAYYPPLENLPTFDVKVFRDAQDVVDYSTTTSNIALTSDNSSGTYYIPFSKTTSTVSNALYIDNVTTPLTYDPATGTLSATNFSGSLSGTATNANNLLTTDTNTQIMYLLGSNDNTTNTGSIYKTTGSGGLGLYYQPNLGTLWTSNITLYEYGNSLNQSSISINSGVLEISNIGNTSPTITRFLNKNSAGTQRIVLTLNGNAGASTFDGNANTATTATNATNVNLTVDNTANTYYVTFAGSGGGNKALLYDTTTTPLSYVPSTSTLTASTFSGSLSGTATNATNVNLTVDNTATTYYVTFAGSGGGNKALLYDTTTTPLSYVPSTSTLTATNFSGLASNASQVNITTNNTAGTFYLVFASSAGTGQNALQYDDTTSPLSYIPSTSTLSCSTVTASLNGNASTASTATTSNNIALTSDNTAGTYYIPFSKTTSATSNALFIDNVTTPLTYDPSTSTLTASIFNGTVTNSTNATNATNINLTDNSSSSTVHYLTYATSGGGNKPLYYSYVSNQLAFKPDVGTLESNDFTCNTFNCNTIATISTVDTSTLQSSTSTLTIKTTILATSIQLKPNSTLVLDVKTNGIDAYQSIDMKTKDITNATNITATNFNGTATTANNIALTSDNSVGTYYIPFSKTTSATSNALYIDDVTTPLTYNPNSSTLSCFTVSANLNGNATTASTATTSNNIALTSDNTAGTYYIPFSKTTSATSNALFIDNVTTPLTYDPSTSTLTATNFSGNASTASTATTSNNVALTSDNSVGTYYIPFSKTTSATSNTLYIDDVTTPLTYDPSTSTLTATNFSGNASTSTTATTATTATTSNNIALTSDNTAGTYYIPFSKTTSATSNTLYIDDVTTPLTYNPSTSTLTATNFSGNASTASTATTSNNVALTSDNTAGTYYIPFSKTTSATSNTLYIDDVTTPLTYNPSTSTLTATNFSGNASTSTTASTATTSNNVALTSDNTAGTYYIPFSKTTSATSNTLYIDNVTTPLTYNPNTSTLTATNFSGLASASTTSAVTITSIGADQFVPCMGVATVTAGNYGFQIGTTVGNNIRFNNATGALTVTKYYGDASSLSNVPTSISLTNLGAYQVVPLINTPTSTAGNYQASIATTYANNLFLDNTLGKMTCKTIVPSVALEITPKNFTFATSATTFTIGNGGATVNQTNLVMTNTSARTVAYTTGQNVVIGTDACATTTTAFAKNVMVGYGAGNTCTSSTDNVMIGNIAGGGTTSGGANVFIGSGSGFQSLTTGTGGSNTCVGTQAGNAMTTTANGNCLIGAGVATGITTGANNTCLGTNSGDNITTGSSNITIGNLATVPTATSSNQIAIGTSSDTMYIRGGFNWRVGTQITANITLTDPLAQFYTVAMTAATQTITLPAPNNTTLLGQTIMFKRKTNTTAFTLAAGAGTPFIPIASITAAATVAVGTTVFQVELVCDGTNWCVVSQA